MDQTVQSFKLPTFVDTTLLNLKFAELSTCGTVSPFAREINSIDFWFRKCCHNKMDTSMLCKWKKVLQCKFNREMWEKLFRNMCVKSDLSGKFKSPVNEVLEQAFPNDPDSIQKVKKAFACCHIEYQWLVEEFDIVGIFTPVGKQTRDILVVELKNRSVRYHFETIEKNPKLIKAQFIFKSEIPEKLSFVEFYVERGIKVEHPPRRPPVRFWPDIQVHRSLFAENT